MPVKPYKHGKVVDDDVRQEIAAVLRKYGLAPVDMLQDLGELYMRERWGVKGDMHLQSKVSDRATIDAERAMQRAETAERNAEIARNQTMRLADELYAVRSVRDQCMDRLSDALYSLAENPWRRAARLTLKDARTTLRRVRDTTLQRVLAWRG